MPRRSLRHKSCHRIAILEFITGGGMVSQPIGEIPSSLLNEGRAMLRALATDCASMPEWEVFVCWDTRLGELEIPNVSVRSVGLDSLLLASWFKLAEEMDFVIVIAPEIDSQLLTITDALRASGVFILNADSEFMKAASDKWLSAQCFQRANILHPKTQRVVDFISESSVAESHRSDANLHLTVEAIESMIESGKWRNSSSAWVIKPRDGVGCQEVFRLNSLESVHDFIRIGTKNGFDWNRYLIQPWIEGLSGSVAVLAGGEELCVLPAMSQNLRVDANLLRSEVEYCGGAGPFQPHLQSLIESFAMRVVRALPGCPRGWIGIDFVLADSVSPEDSIVAIEVNPRLTTSYLGVRKIVSENLGYLLLQAAMGFESRFSLSGQSASFDSFGMSTDDKLY